MTGWLKRFSLHLAAAVGATGIFVAAAAVGATQTRQQVAVVDVPTQVSRPRTPTAQRKPSPVPGVQTQTRPQPQANVEPSPSPSPAPATAPQKVLPERSVSGTIQNVLGDGVEIVAASGREFRVTPAPGALIRLNGKPAKLEGLQPGDKVVILGQAQGGPANRFLAHAITARRP